MSGTEPTIAVRDVICFAVIVRKSEAPFRLGNAERGFFRACGRNVSTLISFMDALFFVIATTTGR
jgi:hypothetical protein